MPSKLTWGGYGEASHNHILTEKDARTVLKIVESTPNYSRDALASRFRVCMGTIEALISGRSWPHLPRPFINSAEWRKESLKRTPEVRRKLSEANRNKTAAMFKQRFEGCIRKTESCWLWKGTTLANGYGQFQHHRKRYTAHRMAWIIANGQIPDGMMVLHHCDVRACVNPAHLFIGTPKDNTRDMVEKGRAKGPLQPMTKLEACEIPTIMCRHFAEGRNMTEIAREFGVHRMTIDAIVKGHTWKHLTGMR